VDDKSISFSKTYECTSADPTIKQLFLYLLDAAIRADPMPVGDHADTAEEGKLVLPSECIGSFVPALQRRSQSSVAERASLKRSFEDRDDEGGESESAHAALHSFTAW